MRARDPFISVVGLVRVLLGIAPLAMALTSHQTQAQSKGWQPITTERDVDFAFIVYPYGDGANAGAVIKIANRNSTPISYSFRVVFRSEDRQWTSEIVRGRLDALEVRTGEMSGLWWIPFKDGAPITEVGLKGLQIRMEQENATTSDPGDSG